MRWAPDLSARRAATNRSPVWVAVSGGFDPLHIGHVRLFKAAKKLGDRLVVILNNDKWLKLKKGFVFMPQKERAELVKSFPFVDRVVLTDHRGDDTDMSVARTLKKLKPAIFANGGDRGQRNTPEDDVCKELGIERKYGVGHGGKIQSSSWMTRDAARGVARAVRPWGEFYGWDSGKAWNLKTVYIKPGKRLSLQYHHRREEYWLLVEGDATATVHDERGRAKEVALKKGEIFRVGKKQVHRLASRLGGVVVEVAHGSFDEGDIVRIEDDYGRVS